MSNQNEELIRTAYQAWADGDTATMLAFVDEDLEWTYFDPSIEHPEPQVCHGRKQLSVALERRARNGLVTELEEVVGNGDKVVAVTRTPGIEAHRLKAAHDLNFSVLTVHDGRIVALRDCRDREEALALAGIG